MATFLQTLQDAAGAKRVEINERFNTVVVPCMDYLMMSIKQHMLEDVLRGYCYFAVGDIPLTHDELSAFVTGLQENEHFTGVKFRLEIKMNKERKMYTIVCQWEVD